jgi:hypothetical protein
MIHPNKSAKGEKARGKQPEFVLRAQRALRRAARKVRTENRRLGLPLIVWKEGKVQPIQA